MIDETEISKLIKKYLDNTYSEKDIPIIREVLSNPKYNTILDRHLEEHWAELEYTNPENDTLSLTDVTSLEPKKKPLMTIKRIVVAASILLLISLSALLFNRIVTPFEEVMMLSEQTSHGESKTIELSDGSVVQLNSCSKLFYPSRFDDEERIVSLEGEAFFNVFRNPNKEFIVETNTLKVRVLGTEFNVRSHSEDESETISVASGRVEVEMADATIRLSQAEHLDISKLINSHSKYTDSNDIAVWRFGRLKFNKTPIADVAHELERIYNCTIRFSTNQVFSNKITGEHSNYDIEDVLQSIQLTTGIKYHFDKNKNEILFYR